MGTFSSRGLRGALLEEVINRTNAAYLEDDLAVIQKLPTSIRPIEVDNAKHVITLAYFETRSTVDYMGAVQGIPICFDAKETKTKSLPMENIHEHQIHFMQRFAHHGGIAFLLVHFSLLDQTYLLPILTLLPLWNAAKQGGKKSISYTQFDPKYEVFAKGKYLVHYLDKLNIYIEEFLSE